MGVKFLESWLLIPMLHRLCSHIPAMTWLLKLTNWTWTVGFNHQKTICWHGHKAEMFLRFGTRDFDKNWRIVFDNLCLLIFRIISQSASPVFGPRWSRLRPCTVKTLTPLFSIILAYLIVASSLSMIRIFAVMRAPVERADSIIDLISDQSSCIWDP